ncbi:DUF7266 family protein [Haloarchaeobius amylolyticus]|uniref:DUF7266 family protein n=1 Tax=Haloarchaeobius amylolyticus TaxID=1198296 RepID=UPI00226FFCF6|nr:hypothetical protein [Haloarchaeobius amylolyticus]
MRLDRADDRDRGLSPVVGKVMETSVVLLYLGLLTTTLYAGVVPDYRAATGDEVADRTLSAATQRVEAAVPPNASRVTVRRTVDLPRTIRGDPYEVRTTGDRLVLAHPDHRVTSEATLALPAHVVRVEGNWTSSAPAVLVVEPASGGPGVVVRLERGGTP